MLAATDSTLFALKLFQRSFREASAQQFSQFQDRLHKSGLSWTLDKIRCDIFPSNPGLEEGLPNFYYYYIPGALYGTGGPAPSAPLDPAFTARADGVGLNFGCPIRLHAALKVLERIEPEFDGPCSESLRTNHKHLPTVEELLWGDAWEFGLLADRNTYGNGNKKPDWKVADSVGDILVEAKFLPSDWARLVDGPTQLPKECMKRAAQQLPTTPPSTTLNMAAFTGFNDMERPFGEAMAEELLKYPHIHGVIYRGFRSDTYLLSLSESVLKRLEPCIRLECTNDYQPFYPCSWNISEREAREVERQNSPTAPSLPQGSRETIFWKKFPLTCALNRLRRPPFTYRRTLLSREPDGEPIFRIETPYIVR